MFRILAALLLVIPFLPYLGFGIFEGRKPGLNNLEYIFPKVWFLGITIVFLFSFLLAAVLTYFDKKNLAIQFLRHNYKKLSKYSLAFVVIVSTILITCISKLCFNYRPHSVDSIVQVLQAKIFASGQMVQKLTEPLENIYILNMLVNEGSWSGQYPPGHSLLLSLGELFSCIYVVPLVLSLCSIFFVRDFAKNIYDKLTANLTALLFLACPFFLFMSASHMNHVSMFFAVSGMFFAYARFKHSGKTLYLVLLAVFSGLGLIVRPWTALAFILLLSVPLIKVIKDERNWIATACSSLVFFLITSIYLIYNKYSTGAFFETGYIKNWGAGHGLGFHSSPWGLNFSFVDGLSNQLLNLIAANFYFLENLWPAFIPIVIYFLFNKKYSSGDKLCFASLLILPVFHIFYWHTDFYLGPRFLYSAIGFYLILLSRSLIFIYKSLNSYDWRGVSYQKIFICFVLISFIYHFTYGLPQRVKVLQTTKQAFKIDLKKEMQAQNISADNIYIKVSWGSRVISRLRGKGLSSSLTEVAFKKIDVCELDQMSKLNSLKEIMARVSFLLEENQPVYKNSIAKDGSRFYQPFRLTPECLDELSYDQDGYTFYAPYILENSINKHNHYTVLRDMRGPYKKNSYLFDGDSLREKKK